MQTSPASAAHRSPTTPPIEHASGAANASEAEQRVCVHLNGTPHELPNATLYAALAQLSLSADTRHVAIAVNETVVPRTAWDRVSLQDDDRVEIITAVAGG